MISKYKTVIFVNGCFWHQHGCRLSPMPKTNTEAWRKKLNANRLRDDRNREALNALGWQVVTIWECDLKSQPEHVYHELQSALCAKSQGGELADKPSTAGSPPTG